MPFGNTIGIFPFTSISASDPSSILGSGLHTWLRSDTVVLNAGNVATWTDKTGNGHSPTQATSANQIPYVSSGGAGGNAYLNCTGTAGVTLGLTTYTVNAPFEIFCVCSPAAEGGILPVNFGPTGAGSPGMTFQYESGTVRYFVDVTFASSGSDSLNVAQVVSMQIGASSSVGVVNNGTGTIGTTTPISDTASTQRIVIAAFALNGAGVFNGKIYELLVANRACTTSERSQLQTYFNSRYNLT